MTAQEWIYLNKIENEELILAKFNKYNKECYLLNKVTSSNDMEMREKLKEVNFIFKEILTHFQIEIS